MSALGSIRPTTSRKKGTGLIRPEQLGRFYFSEFDEPVSGFDYVKRNGAGPQGVPPPEGAPDVGALPETWFSQPRKRVSHD